MHTSIICFCFCFVLSACSFRVMHSNKEQVVTDTAGDTLGQVIAPKLWMGFPSPVDGPGWTVHTVVLSSLMLAVTVLHKHLELGRKESKAFHPTPEQLGLPWAPVLTNWVDVSQMIDLHGINWKLQGRKLFFQEVNSPLESPYLSQRKPSMAVYWMNREMSDSYQHFINPKTNSKSSLSPWKQLCKTRHLCL